MNDNFSSMYANDLHSNDQPTTESPNNTTPPPTAKSPRAKMHTRMVMTFVSLVVLAVASIGVLLFASSKSQDQRSKASETAEQMGYCAQTCASPYVKSDLGTSSCHQTGYVYCVLPTTPRPTTADSMPKSTPTLDPSFVDFQPYTGNGYLNGIKKVDQLNFDYAVKNVGSHSMSTSSIMVISPKILDSTNFESTYLSAPESDIAGLAFDDVIANGYAAKTRSFGRAPKVNEYVCIFIGRAFDSNTSNNTGCISMNSAAVNTPTPAVTTNCPVCTILSTNTRTCVPAMNGSSCNDPYGMGGTCSNGKCVGGGSSPVTPTTVRLLTPTPTPASCPVCQTKLGVGCYPSPNGTLCGNGYPTSMRCSNGYCKTVTPTPTKAKTPTPVKSPTPSVSVSSCYNKPNGYPCAPGKNCMNNQCVSMTAPTSIQYVTPTPYR